MTAALDTNVLVSAALAISANVDTGSRYIFEDALLRKGAFENFTCPNSLFELGDVLGRPRLQLSPAFVLNFVALYTKASTLLRIQGLFMGCRDRKDDKLLEVAVNANVDYIVCRDKDLYDPKAQFGISKTGLGIRGRPIQVVTVEFFAQQLRNNAA